MKITPEEAQFLEIIRRAKPYLFDMENAIQQLLVKGFGNVQFDVTVKDGKVLMVDLSVTEKKKYI